MNEILDFYTPHKGVLQAFKNSDISTLENLKSSCDRECFRKAYSLFLGIERFFNKDAMSDQVHNYIKEQYNFSYLHQQQSHKISNDNEKFDQFKASFKEFSFQMPQSEKYKYLTSISHTEFKKDYNVYS